MEVYDIHCEGQYVRTSRLSRLTRNTRGDILTLVALPAARDINIPPGPVGAATVTTENVHGNSIIVHRTSHAIDSNPSDLDIIAGRAA